MDSTTPPKKSNGTAAVVIIVIIMIGIIAFLIWHYAIKKCGQTGDNCSSSSDCCSGACSSNSTCVSSCLDCGATCSESKDCCFGLKCGDNKTCITDDKEITSLPVNDQYITTMYKKKKYYLTFDSGGKGVWETSPGLTFTLNSSGILTYGLAGASLQIKKSGSGCRLETTTDSNEGTVFTSSNNMITVVTNNFPWIIDDDSGTLKALAADKSDCSNAASMSPVVVSIENS